MAKILSNNVVIRLPHKPNNKELAKLCRQFSLIHGGRIMASTKTSMLDKTLYNGTAVHVDPVNCVVFFQQSRDHMIMAARAAYFN